MQKEEKADGRRRFGDSKIRWKCGMMDE